MACSNQMPGVVRVQCFCEQPIECKSISAHVGALLEIGVACHDLDAHHGGVSQLRDVIDHERRSRVKYGRLHSAARFGLVVLLCSALATKWRSSSLMTARSGGQWR